MRVSCNEDDPGYRPIDVTKHLRVYVDGRQVRRCFTADEEKGVAYCFAEDSEGNLYLDPEGEIKTVEFRGVVRIEGI